MEHSIDPNSVAVSIRRGVEPVVAATVEDSWRCRVEPAVAGDRIGHVRASARIEERSVAPGRCLEPGAAGCLELWSSEMIRVDDQIVCYQRNTDRSKL
eukprot:1388494-Prymnesium_polylepis.1